MSDEVKLFGVYTSPYSFRIELALKLKGVKYELIREDLSNKTPLLLTYNPVHKKIPVLVHNGNPIAESLVILEYIDETWEGPRILPRDPYERSLARFWSKFIDDKCMASLRKLFKEGEGEDEARDFLKILENEVKGKKFFGGDSFGMVDIAGLFIAYWLEILCEVFGIELLTKENFPNLCKWSQEFVSCEIVKENLPSTQDLRAYYQNWIVAATTVSKQ